MICQPSTGELNIYEQLLCLPSCKDQDIESKYEEFVSRSYPFATVRFLDMKDLLTGLGFKGRELCAFRALDISKFGELNCRNFILGLIAMDPKTNHGNATAEIRCRYIFRFYDANVDSYLDVSEVEEMLADIERLKSGHPGQASHASKQELIANAMNIFGATNSGKVTKNSFLVAVGNLKFRGTSLLFRSKMPVVMCLKHQPGASSINPAKSLQLDNTSNAVAMEVDYPDEFPHSDAEVSHYSLAQHTVKVRRTGQASDIQLLLDLQKRGSLSDTGLDIHSSKPAGSHFKLPSQLVYGLGNKRVQSSEVFNTQSLSNELLKALRFFELELKDKKVAMNWGEIDRIKLGNYLISICGDVKSLVESEPRMLSIESPCYVMGDIHGSFHDLMAFEKSLWRIGPHLTPANFLFLGDYVDRGKHSVEVVAYLFAQKVQSPNNFHLLRGNHEIRSVQKMFNFFSDCSTMFGKQLGFHVWNAINDVFDCMPLSAVIDKQIFCLHGGIPLLKSDIGELQKIPCPLPDPEKQNQVAWQMMWNDPLPPDTVHMNEEELKMNNGFIFNQNRLTALCFSSDAFTSFLKKHGFSHVIRAHEVKQVGFEVQQCGRLLTVFSSSKYCGGTNESACVLIDKKRLRFIRFDSLKFLQLRNRDS